MCDQPEYWSGWMLEQCIDLLGQLHSDQLQAVLSQALQQPALPRPADHQDHRSTHMFRLSLSSQQRCDVLADLRRAKAMGLSTAASQKRGLGGFLEAWQAYAQQKN